MASWSVATARPPGRRCASPWRGPARSPGVARRCRRPCRRRTGRCRPCASRRSGASCGLERLEQAVLLGADALDRPAHLGGGRRASKPGVWSAPIRLSCSHGSFSIAVSSSVVPSSGTRRPLTPRPVRRRPRRSRPRPGLEERRGDRLLLGSAGHLGDHGLLLPAPSSAGAATHGEVGGDLVAGLGVALGLPGLGVGDRLGPSRGTCRAGGPTSCAGVPASRGPGADLVARLAGGVVSSLWRWRSPRRRPSSAGRRWRRSRGPAARPTQAPGGTRSCPWWRRRGTGP